MPPLPSLLAMPYIVRKLNSRVPFAVRAVCAVLGLFSAATSAQAQERYLVRTPAATQGTPVAVLVNDVEESGGQVLRTYNFPRFNYLAAAVRLDGGSVQALIARGYIVRQDTRLRPMNSFATEPEKWHLNCLAGTGTRPAAGACGGPATLYVVDTGVNSAHADFSLPQSSGSLEFLPGITTAVYLNPFPTPTTPVPPYLDTYDHGTRMAGVVAGQDSGLLGRLNTRVKIKSVQAYDIDPAAGAGFTSTWASSCIAAVYAVGNDHLLRLENSPYIRNHASVLLFAHSTEIISGHEGDLDAALDTVRGQGVHVVLAGGNEGLNVPSVVAGTVSPAGMGFAYKLGINPPVRFWLGAAPVGSTYLRIPATADSIFVIGGHRGDNTLWLGSNRNAPLVSAVDFLAPGSGIRTTMASGGFGSFSGTSYAAALTAATACHVLERRPWALPAETKSILMSSTTLSATTGYQKLGIPSPTSYAGICLDYGGWLEHYDLAGPQAAATADPDFDGKTNMLEYCFGTDPRFPDLALSATIVQPSTTKVKFQVPLACYRCPELGVTMSLQTSTDLTAWSTLGSTSLATMTSVGYTLTALPQSMGDGQVHESSTVAHAVGSRRFFRLHFSGVL